MAINKPIHVLHVVHGMDCGGTESMIMNLYRNIDRDKVQFDFLVHTDKKCYFDEEIQQLGGNIYHVPYYKIINEYRYRIALNDFFEEHHEIKIVHGHLGSCSHIYLAIAKKYNCFTIAHSHNTKPNFTLKSILYRIFTYHTRKIADYFMACSQAAGDYRYGKKISHSNRYTTLNNAINAKNYTYNLPTRNHVREKYNLTSELVIGHIGRFNTQKNHEFLIDIFKAVVDKHPNSKLILVGDGVLKPEIEKKVKVFGLTNKVIFTGIRKDVPDLLQAFDCFIFPSLYEGLGIVAVEAQAAGLPTICSDVLPLEAHITDLFISLSLSQPPQKWAGTILKNAPISNRTDTYDAIKKAGYDINSTAKWLENFYLSKN